MIDVWIKVEPYWNVNYQEDKLTILSPVIKVEPYWNVNLFLLFCLYNHHLLK